MRLATMFGLGLITAGVWAAFDSHFLMRSNAQDVPVNYRQWTATLALVMTLLGAILLSGTEYVVKSDIYPALTTAYPFLGWVVLLACVVFLALLLAKTGSAWFVGIAALLQFLTLAAFGVIRQIGQNSVAATFIDVSQWPEAVEWDTLIAFVVFFLLGVGVIVWMVVQCVKWSGK
jgi:hypothetical protein